jgi:tRNA(Arg) A34 adenosine deaminase TadA
MPQELFMRLAIAKAAKGIAAGQFPYGATIVRYGAVIASAHNVVGKTSDPTAHAEVHAIRRACKRLGSANLSECEIYCTCEPCAMCMGACYSAHISAIYFGASIADKAAFKLTDLGVGAWALRKQPGAPKVARHFLRADCVALFETFVRKANNAAPAAVVPPEGKPGARRRR